MEEKSWKDQRIDKIEKMDAPEILKIIAMQLVEIAWDTDEIKSKLENLLERE